METRGIHQNKIQVIIAVTTVATVVVIAVATVVAIVAGFLIVSLSLKISVQLKNMYTITSLIFLLLGITAIVSTAFDIQKKCTCGQNKNIRGRIVGGQEAEVNEFPWQVLVTMRGRNFCGASVINDLYVVMAAHCFVAYSSRKNKIVRTKLSSMEFIFGEHRIDSKNESITQVRKPIAVRIHREYKPKTFENDIAVVKMNKPVKFNYFVLPVCLLYLHRDQFLPDSTKVVVSGFGLTDAKDRSSASSVLKKAFVSIVNASICEKVYRNFNRKKMICAYNSLQHDSCQGDSGGPLTLYIKQHYYLVGVVSFGKGCGEKLYPGVYTRVSSYVKWIIRNTRHGSFCQYKKFT